MKIFDGYVRNYHTFNLTMHHGKHSFTIAEIEYFSRLGSMPGYFSFTEDTCNGSYRAMDLTWWENDNEEYWGDFILHLECENLFKKDVETLEKLFDDRDHVPYNAIGIMNVNNVTKMEELVEQAQRMCNNNNTLLIFRTNSFGNTKKYFDEVHAYLLDGKNIVNRKKAYVDEMAGILFMHFDRK
ncbi:hypothetical protein [Bacillus cereus group sp. BceL293]|uniref:hypothetical protein n=1 Tax=Bacillus cereus group sp. BceL293 TaxID=3444992 RepID=UPI003F21F2CB